MLTPQTLRLHIVLVGPHMLTSWSTLSIPQTYTHTNPHLDCIESTHRHTHTDTHPPTDTNTHMWPRNCLVMAINSWWDLTGYFPFTTWYYLVPSYWWRNNCQWGAGASVLPPISSLLRNCSLQSYPICNGCLQSKIQSPVSLCLQSSLLCPNS